MNNWKPLFSVAIFLGTQCVGAVIATLFDLMANRSGNTATADITLFTWTLILTGIASVLIIRYLLKSIDFKEAFHTRNAGNRRNWTASLIALTGSLIGIFGINLLSEQLNLPDLAQEEFLAMSQSTIGILSIALIVPIVEELIFRESIEGYMLRQGKKPWFAIGTSSLLFGIAHLNPSQILFAALIGLIFGILYWKTRNVWLCILLHIINNSQAVWQMKVLGEGAREYRMSDEIGSTSSVWIIIILAVLICISLIWRFCQTYQSTDPDTQTVTS